MLGLLHGLIDLGILIGGGAKEAFHDEFSKNSARNGGKRYYLDSHCRYHAADTGELCEWFAGCLVTVRGRRVIWDPKFEEREKYKKEIEEQNEIYKKEDEERRQEAIKNGKHYYKIMANDNEFLDRLNNNPRRLRMTYGRIEDDLLMYYKQDIPYNDSIRDGINWKEKCRSAGYLDDKYNLFVAPIVQPMPLWEREYQKYINRIGDNTKIYDENNEEMVEYVKKYNIPLVPISKEEFFEKYIVDKDVFDICLED